MALNYISAAEAASLIKHGYNIRTCVADGIRAGNDEVVDELLKTLQKLMK